MSNTHRGGSTDFAFRAGRARFESFQESSDPVSFTKDKNLTHQIIGGPVSVPFNKKKRRYFPVCSEQNKCVHIINRLTFTEQCALKSVTAPVVFCGAYLPTGNLSSLQ